jgi:hypothetical protein
VWESLLVGILVVVEVGREVYEKRLFVADYFEAVPARAGDSDGLLVVFADNEGVHLTLRR